MYSGYAFYERWNLTLNSFSFIHILFGRNYLSRGKRVSFCVFLTSSGPLSLISCVLNRLVCITLFSITIGRAAYFSSGFNVFDSYRS